jgi:S1-C subfamily serine protease
MKISPRRAVSTILAAALLLGSVPSGAQAQVLRVAAGQTGGMPVSPSGFSAPQMTAPVLTLGAASLTGTLSAPSIAPSPVITAAAAAAAQPAAVVPAALSASVRAAASEDAPKLPDAPSAAPVAKATWTERFTSLFSRKPAAAPTPVEGAESPEAAKSGADISFDGSSEKEGEAAAPAVAGAPSRLKAALSAKISTRANAAAAKRALTVDAFGGPLTEPMSFRQRVGYGLKQGLHLVGIGALLEVTLRPFLNLFPWPQYMSDHALRGFGRIALLTKYGPNEILAGLAGSPAKFLGLSLPMAVTMEEITYRLLGFGLIFLVLAAIKPFTRWISSMIDGLPDAAGAVGGAKRVLKIGDWISHLAFPIAAAISSYNFAVAHFASWGFSPFVLALNFILGLYLAHTAYKSRSLTAPIIAHLVFNLVTMGGLLLTLAYSPAAGAAFAIISGLLGVASLLHGWLSSRKERAFRLKFGAKALVAVMVAGLSLQMLNVPSPRTDSASAVHQAQEQTQTIPPEILARIDKALGAPAPADTAVIESRADMVARVKPSVVNVIVHMQGGYAIGSGFILTPSGVFVTNGHVVGSKMPGEFVNARVPGVNGELTAKVLAVNHDKDLAIVQLQPRPDGKPWPTVKLAATAPREGEEVTAIGYPRGLPFTVTKGVVSGLDGRGSMYVRKLQTDAAINPGNSGGPLFNDKGEVIGVNTEINTQSGGSEGLGFSIQAPEVGRVMAQYAKTGNIATASLGIIVNLSDPMTPDAGIAIEYVRRGSAAEKAGLKRGDLIIGVGETSIDEGGQEGAGHIASVLSKMIPGQKTMITVLRGDSPVQIELTVDAKVTEAPSH